MSNSSMISTINQIFIDVLDEENIVITPETTAQDIEEWDSLNHIHLVVAIEKHFKVRFSSQEIGRWKNVGEMCASILEKTSLA